LSSRALCKSTYFLMYGERML